MDGRDTGYEPLQLFGLPGLMACRARHATVTRTAPKTTSRGWQPIHATSKGSNTTNPRPNMPDSSRLWRQAYPISGATLAQLRTLPFPAGSMGPKVEALCRFVKRTGGVGAVGALVDTEAILARHTTQLGLPADDPTG